MSHAEFDFGLPPFTAEERPAFTDEGSCREWLSGLAMTNVALAQTQLMKQLSLLNRFTLPTDGRLKVLEMLRGPIDFVQDQCLQRYAGRPLPFNAVDQAAFDSSHALWQEFVTGYLHCVQAALRRVTETADSPHLLASVAATRALTAMLAIHLDACQANLVTAPTFWGRLHLIFRAAEELKVTQLPVEGGLRRNSKTTAASAYIEVLLLAAAFPTELRTKQLSMVAAWARSWSNKVTILRHHPDDQKTPALRVDLTSNNGASFQDKPGRSDAVRWLDLSELRKSIKKRLVLLARGASPQTLRLGTDCVQPACGALLQRIYQCWCKGGLKEDANPLRIARRNNSTCHLASSFEAIHYYLTGQKRLRQDRSIYLNRQEHDEIATFGRIATHSAEGNSEMPGFMLEEWRIVGQNATELHLERNLTGMCTPLVGGQLVAVRLHHTEGFVVGKISQIAINASRDGLIAKIRLLAGRPEGITLLNSSPGSSQTQYSRGLFLPEVEQLGETASMLVPTGWFTVNRIVGVQVPSDDTHQIRLDHLIERGADFERVAFEWL